MSPLLLFSGPVCEVSPIPLYAGALTYLISLRISLQFISKISCHEHYLDDFVNKSLNTSLVLLWS